LFSPLKLGQTADFALCFEDKNNATYCIVMFLADGYSLDRSNIHVIHFQNAQR